MSFLSLRLDRWNSRSAAQVLGGLGPAGEVECKARLGQTARDDVAALQDHLGLGAQKPRPDLQHPLGRGQAHPNACGVPQGAHEGGIGERIGCGEVDWAGQAAVAQQEADGAHEVAFVYPRNVLPPVPVPAAQPAPGQAQQRVEHAPTVNAHYHRRAQDRLAGVGRRGLFLRRFPPMGDIEAEAPGIRQVWLRAPQDARNVIVGGVIAVRVGRRRAGLEPNARRAGRPRDGLPHDPRRTDTRGRRPGRPLPASVSHGGHGCAENRRPAFLLTACWTRLHKKANALTELETIRPFRPATKDEKKDAQKRENDLARPLEG